MKKNILGLLLIICCMGLFTSCSDDDNNGIDAGQMHVSAVLPASITAGGQRTLSGTNCVASSNFGQKAKFHNRLIVMK